jgi:inhibitor of cysteine peptidase
MVDDKFILIKMDDERSKKVAEVLNNKTSKNILEYLTDNSNKSEEDIAKALNMKINTVEYNLKKLLKTGLIEKSNNFFWSKKGRRIVLYKPAKKHIIISPRDSKLNAQSLNAILPTIFIAMAVGIIGLMVFFSQSSQSISEGDFQTFNSLNDMKNFIEKNSLNGGGIRTFLDGGVGVMKSDTAMAEGSPSAAGGNDGATSYSETNIQVEGVDEPDIIKNDGKYIYAVTGGNVFIIEAYPANDMEILSEIKNSEEYVSEIFVNGDKLVIFTQEYGPVLYAERDCLGCVIPPHYEEPRSLIKIYDISNKENPELDEEISFTGNYFDSRMIGDYIYVVGNQYIYSDLVLPSVTVNDETKVIEPTEIYYQEYVEDYSFQYTIILAIDLENYEVSEKVMVTGSTHNIFVSQDNIFTTFTKYSNRWIEQNAQESEKTIINKISIDKLNINFVATGEVKGHILNQFSIDEYEGNLRIATTVGDMWNEENPSINNVYVLDENLDLIGELENLAPGERIYSVRFMGEKGYVVTFKKVDPLFVMDLSDPENPDVLGKLKIPGYSDYLHPYDETHIIGIGKEAVEADEEDMFGRGIDFAWYQGVKIAIFDVSDVENPIEMHKIVIGDRGTQSEALYDHKAFLFDREKELMVIPITLAEISEEEKQEYDGYGVPPYGDVVFQGAHVYNINLEEGFDLVGQISHYDENEVEKKSGYYWYGNRNIRRSLYMDETLYTFSNEILMTNSLWDLDEISSVEFPVEDYWDGRYY